MGLISVVVVLVLVGTLLYVVENALPIAAPVKTIIRAVVVVVLCLWLLQLFVGDVPLPRFR